MIDKVYIWLGIVFEVVGAINLFVFSLINFDEFKIILSVLIATSGLLLSFRGNQIIIEDKIDKILKR